MADVDYQCVDCGARRMVSEFADIARLKCPDCGGALRRPGDLKAGTAAAQGRVPGEGPAAEAAAGRLKVARRVHTPILDAPAEAADGKTADKREPLELHPKVRHRRGVSHLLLAVLAFLVVGGGMYYLRYMEGAHTAYVEMARPWSWTLVLVLHLLVVTRAAVDNMFQGILCLLVPGWSVVYLLFISDNFYLKAVVCGLLVGCGQDGGLQLLEWVQDRATAFSGFIESGGGEIRRR